MSVTWGIRHQSVVLCLKTQIAIIVTKVDFPWFSTTNVFVAFPTNFPADQNVMSFAGGNLAFHSGDKTLAVSSLRNMNLN